MITGEALPVSDTGVENFQFAFPSDALADLRRRLSDTRWSYGGDETGWDDGAPLKYLQELVGYWRSEYDWREQQSRLNAYPQYTTVIDGEPIHFVWRRSDHVDRQPIPIIMTHGWPGSVVEFLTVSDLLAAAGFDVVIPTIPGFGLPGALKGTDWTVDRVARGWAELMRRLGYDQYVAHGGDIGTVITRQLGFVDEDHVRGLHVTSVAGGIPDIGAKQEHELMTRAEKAAFRYRYGLSAYAQLHSTKPHSLAHALADSPVGLLAWIVERFHDWTAAIAAPEEVVGRDEILTNTMIYWMSNSFASSARFYKVNGLLAPYEIPVSRVPTAVSVFHDDIIISERSLAERYNNISMWVEHEMGGHFPGLERPNALVADICSAFA